MDILEENFPEAVCDTIQQMRKERELEARLLYEEMEVEDTDNNADPAINISCALREILDRLQWVFGVMYLNDDDADLPGSPSLEDSSTEEGMLEDPLLEEPTDEAPVDEGFTDEELMGEEPMDEETMDKNPTGDEPMDEDLDDKEPLLEDALTSLLHAKRQFENVSTQAVEYSRNAPRSDASDSFRRDHRKLLKRILSQLDLIERCNEMWGTFESTLEETEADLQDSRNYMAGMSKNHQMIKWASKWRSWALTSATKCYYTAEEMSDAIARNGSIQACALLLARDGTNIVQHWRMDVNEVVEDIIQTNYSHALAVQSADIRETFANVEVTGRKGEHRRILLNTAHINRTQYQLRSAAFAVERMSIMANTLERFDDMRFSLGQYYYGLTHALTYVDGNLMKKMREEKYDELDVQW